MKSIDSRTAAVWCAVWLGLTASVWAAEGDHGLTGLWTVHAGSSEQILHLDAGTACGTNLAGTLGEVELSGFVTSGEIVLHGEGVILMGWLGRDAAGELFMAGRRRDSSGEIDRVSGWYAVVVPTQQASEPTDEPVPVDGDEAAAQVQAFDLVVPETTSPVVGDATAAASAGSSAITGSATGTTGGAAQWSGTFAGNWQGPDGLYRIEQEGSRITVYRPNGESVGGRQIDIESLMVGLRVGCCRGELSATGVIEWQDGIVWRRAN